MIRIALIISYDGRNFYGFQRQNKVLAVQNLLDQALSKVANCQIITWVSGRTDAKVHATNQVVHFDYPRDKQRSLSAWIKGTNSQLPASIRVKSAFVVDNDFHARFSATSRTYRYLILQNCDQDPHLQGLVTLLADQLDVSAMNQACDYLLGEQNFTTFQAAGCQAKHPIREITKARVIQYDDLLVFEVSANAFLYHMVRNITALLIAIGRGEYNPEYMQQVINCQDRSKIPPTAKPDGLYLVEIKFAQYPQVKPNRIGPFQLK